MGIFFELRTYFIYPGKMNDWVNFMEETIIPYQVSKGAVIVGSFIMDNTNKYVWLRRFESQSEKAKLYKEVYDSDFWKKNIQPKVMLLMDRDKMVIENITPTRMSIIQ